MDQSIITKELLEQAGVDLTDQDVDELLTHLNDTLAERVGAEITESLSDEQLEELVQLQETADDEVVADWLEQNVPELQQMTQDEIDIILGELVEDDDELEAAA